MRRDKGDGSVYQRKDGTWIAQIDISGGLKPRRFLRRSAKSKNDAKTLLKRMAPHCQAMKGNGRVTVGSWLSDWLVRRKTHLRATTFSSYQDMADRVVIPALGHVPLDILTTRQVQLWIDRAIKEGTGRRTVEYARSMLRAALTDAMRNGLLVSNPASLVRLPRAPQKSAPSVQPVHMQHLLKVAKGRWLHPLIVLTLLYGLRRGELLALAEDAIDSRAGTIEIKRTIVRVGNELAVAEPKTARSRRVLPLHPLAKTALATLRKRRAKLSERNDWKPKRKAPKWLIPSEVGAPLNPETLHHAWYRLRKSAGFPTLTWHQLRHAAVAIRKGAGIDTRAIADTVGHVNISLTNVTYDHGTIERIAVGVEATAKAIRSDRLTDRLTKGQKTA